MRSDVTLYIVAAFFFVLTVTSAVIFVDAERSLWIVSTAVLGGLSAGLGYYQRPKAKNSNQKLQTSPASSTTAVELTAEPIHVEAEPSLETPQKNEAETVEEPQEKTVAAQASIVETSASPQVQEPVGVETQKQELNADTRVEQQTVSILTSVKGIGEKRASQLNSLGINTVEELANASVEELAKNLKVSPKIVAKWIEAAKQQ